MTQNNTCDALHTQIEDLTQTQLARMQIPRPIADHVRSCVTCKAFLDQQLALAAEVDLWSVPAPQRHIGTGVMTQIAQLEHDKQTARPAFWTGCVRALRTRIQIPATAAAMVLCLLAVSVVFNLSHLGRARQIAEHMPAPANGLPVQSVQLVQHGNTQSTVFPPAYEPDAIRPWLNQSQLPASTMVIIIGAPPLPWTDLSPQPTHNQSQSL
ncbi:MAG: hypothetical protein GY809_09985 [Planctomycetes bacterium]|nr:hypothetical protein [Planctomycetota bacterium]